MAEQVNLTCELCGNTSLSVRSYCNHFKFHRNRANVTFSCAHNTCSRRFRSYNALKCHIYRDHGKKQPQNRNDQFSDLVCSATACFFTTDNLPDYIVHLNSHIRELLAHFWAVKRDFQIPDLFLLINRESTKTGQLHF